MVVAGRASARSSDAGVETVACDLLDRDAVAALPDAPNVVFMAGQKFGTTGAPGDDLGDERHRAGASAPSAIATSRIVAFSTGNVYPLTPVDARRRARDRRRSAPVGEYAASCLGRERLFELLRGATRNARRDRPPELRDRPALRRAPRHRAAVFARRADSVAMGYVNVIWQGDANRIALECLPHAAAPPFVVNVTGAETLSVRATADALRRALRQTPRVRRRRGADALLSNARACATAVRAARSAVDDDARLGRRLGERGGPLLGKPTHFEARDGTF